MKMELFVKVPSLPHYKTSRRVAQREVAYPVHRIQRDIHISPYREAYTQMAAYRKRHSESFVVAVSEFEASERMSLCGHVLSDPLRTMRIERLVWWAITRL